MIDTIDIYTKSVYAGYLLSLSLSAHITFSFHQMDEMNNIPSIRKLLRHRNVQQRLLSTISLDKRRLINTDSSYKLYARANSSPYHQSLLYSKRNSPIISDITLKYTYKMKFFLHLYFGKKNKLLNNNFINLIKFTLNSDRNILDSIILRYDIVLNKIPGEEHARTNTRTQREKKK